MTGISFRPLEARDAVAAVALEEICYPHLEPSSWLQLTEVAEHVDTFPAGAMVATDGDRLVGMSLAWRVEFDPSDPLHCLDDYGPASAHRPDGAWLYGLDTSVHPDYRGLGIGVAFYARRREIAEDLGLTGIVAGGMLPGYVNHQHLTVEGYIDRVVRGDLSDPTLSFQLAQGFRVEGVLPRYVDSEVAAGAASLLIWRPEK